MEAAGGQHLGQHGRVAEVACLHPHGLEDQLEEGREALRQALLHGHPNSHTEYEFVCRNTPAFPLTELLPEIERELDHLCSMSFSDQELNYLRSLRYMKSDFVDFLTVFRFKRKFIDVRSEGDALVIHAAGPQVHVMGFEIYVLYIVNELYFRRFDQAAALAEGRSRLTAKIAALQEQLELLEPTDTTGLPIWVRDDNLDLTDLPVWKRD